MASFDMIVALAHCVECHDFVEPAGKTAHAVLCTRDEDAATVATLTAEMDAMIYNATADQATAAKLVYEMDQMLLTLTA